MLNDLKLMLGIPKSDAERDELFNWILRSAEERLKNLLGGLEIPDSMRHIVVEASVIRFNRIGSEGLSSHTVANESMLFSDNDFAGFMGEIEAFLDSQNGGKKGRVRFL